MSHILVLIHFSFRSFVFFLLLYPIASQVSLVVKNPPANAGDIRDTTDVNLIPGSGGAPGEETHSSVLAWRIPRTEELVGYSPWGLKESDSIEIYAYTCSPLCCYSAAWKVFSISSSNFSIFFIPAIILYFKKAFSYSPTVPFLI